MAIIKELRLRGFKSFPRLVEIPFDAGYNVVIGANGSGKSLAYDSIVTLSNGEEIEIGKLIEGKLKTSKVKGLEDGVYCDGDGDNIISINPIRFNAEIKPVSKYVRRNGEELYSINTMSGREVKATGCHPVMVFRSGILKSILINELKEKDLIATPRRINIAGDENFDEERARLIGYLIGNGHIAVNRIEFINTDKELLDDFLYLLKKFYPGAKFSERHEKNSTRIICYGKKLVAETRELFKEDYSGPITSDIKKIPNELLASGNRTIRNVLAALFDTDGYVRKDNGTIELCSKNKDMIYQVQRLLMRFEILSKVKKKMCFATNTKYKIKRPYYYLCIYGQKNIRTFYINIPLKCKHKKENLEKLLRFNKRSNPNVDLLPQETNITIKNLVKLLGLNLKNLSKEHPKLRAYYDNRLLPTREGLIGILSIFGKKLKILIDGACNLKLDQGHLISCMDELNISGMPAFRSIGLHHQIIRMNWATGRSNAKKENLANFDNFIKDTINSRLEEIKGNMLILHRLATSDIFWDEITKIEKLPKEKYVYDLTIEGNHNFIANGIYVHNSNIADAICFVLGKTSAKSLRAEKSANLIFHGGKKGNPAKEAQVDIIFDNSNNDFPIKTDELKVSRVVKQKGISTYKLNDGVVTRQQIVDLLGSAKIDPDGHNIILQGDIVQFMEMKPEERRELIEDIAGISVYEDKKQKAMLELEKVDAKLNEASIILTERETFMKELKRERDQAEKYKELEGNVKSNKATYLHLQIKEKEDKRHELERRIKEHEQEYNRYENDIKEIKNHIVKKKDELNSINKDIESKGEVEQKKINADIEKLKIEIAKNSLRFDACNAELEKILNRKKQLEKNLEDVDKNIDELKHKKNKIEKEIKTTSIEEISINNSIGKFKEKHNIKEDFVKDIDELDSSIDNNQSELNKVSQEKQIRQRELDRIRFELDSLKVSENKEKVDELRVLRNDFRAVTTDLSKLMSDLEVTGTQYSKARRSIVELDEKLAKLNAQNIGAKEFSSMDIAIKKTLELKERGVFGTVSDLGRIQSKYSMALSVAAGPRIKSIVVDNDATATKCINYLKETRLGVVTFLPLNKLKSKPISNEIQPILSMPNVNGMAINLVEYDKKFRDVFNYVFGSTIVINDLNTARKIGIGRVRMVTLDGDLVETSGAMMGGYRRKTIGFKEKDFDADIKSIEDEVSKNKKLLDLLENREDELNEKIRGLRNKKALLEADILKYEKAYGIADIEKLKEKRAALVDKEKTIGNEIKACDEKISSINSEVSKLKSLKTKVKERAANTGIASSLNKLEEERSKVKERLLLTRGELSNLDLQINTIFNQEKEKMISIINGSVKEKNEFSNEIANLSILLKDQKNKLKEMESMQKRFYSDYNSLFTKRKKIDEEIKKKDIIIARNEEKIKSTQHRLNNIEIDRAKIAAEIAGLEKEFEQFKCERIRRGLSLQGLKDEINKFENMLKNLGNVNMRALDIYNEADAEYNRILEKTSKLRLEKDDVLKLMAEIEGKKKHMFMITYKELSNNFKDIFNKLSTKGDAYIEIENEEDLFNSGVDIKVKITSNKFLDIKSLSGGEKSMAALAFIFAIQEYQPAAFYLLDEVDAALDKTNSDLLSKLIKKYSEMAQYIVISHNDQVITEADTIYGVSMQEAISKVVSLKV